MEWVLDHKLALIILGLMGGSFWIPGMRIIGIKVIKHLATKAMAKFIFLELADRFVKSTETDFDDKILAEIKKTL
jgi:hypothetical protein|uniref:Uncharacterized protein n=1 Tax=uncultured marine virus TaxID=186617 RepID=A0A0F7L7B9_9VIRU|nr:hypothetical protein [uncultured marine virus]